MKKTKSNKANSKLLMKVYSSPEGKLVALADADALGKKYISGKIVLDLDKYGSFYMGEPSDEQTIISALEECSSANVVGKNSVQLVIRQNMARPSDVVDIGGISHLQIFKIGKN